jgi:LmbE family N-acetylglucosaminyl deacetylase
MSEFKDIFNPAEEKNVLFIFPHYDDCAFVASGLIQSLTKHKITCEVLVLSEFENNKEKNEFEDYSKFLGISKSKILLSTHSNYKSNIKKIILNNRPTTVVTFDPGGVTGNSHHTHISLATYDALREIKNNNIKLLWRIADKEEEKHFGKMPRVLKYSRVLSIKLGLKESYKKIKSIFLNKSKFTKFTFKLRILEWYLFDHSESYYHVNFDKDKIKVNLT